MHPGSRSTAPEPAPYPLAIKSAQEEVTVKKDKPQPIEPQPAQIEPQAQTISGETVEALPAPAAVPDLTAQDQDIAARAKFVRDETDRLLAEGGYIISERNGKLRSEKGEKRLYELGYRPYLALDGKLVENLLGVWAKAPTTAKAKTGKPPLPGTGSDKAPTDPRAAIRYWAKAAAAWREAGAHRNYRTCENRALELAAQIDQDAPAGSTYKIAWAKNGRNWTIKRIEPVSDERETA
jgi:hypothetical protein